MMQRTFDYERDASTHTFTQMYQATVETPSFEYREYQPDIFTAIKYRFKLNKQQLIVIKLYRV